MKNFWQKWSNYEYWPFWAFYGPLTPFFIYNILKTKAPAYFCTANPSFKFGGFINYPKHDFLKNIPSPFLPETHYLQQADKNNPPLNFPFILKPNLGERGDGVELIKNSQAWINYINTNANDLIAQDYCAHPEEFGLFYVRLPKEKNGKLLSITQKKFLSVQGDGKSTLQQLILNDYRASRNKTYLFSKFENQLNSILPNNENLLLEPIGNHSRGTIFLDASHLKTKKLETVVDQVCTNIKGFYYGRLDVKAPSATDLQNGNFVILEVNGTNSEATHIYDPSYTLAKAYKEVLRHLTYQRKIAQQNNQLGHSYIKWSELALELIRYFQKK